MVTLSQTEKERDPAQHHALCQLGSYDDHDQAHIVVPCVQYVQHFADNVERTSSLKPKGNSVLKYCEESSTHDLRDHVPCWGRSGAFHACRRHRTRKNKTSVRDKSAASLSSVAKEKTFPSKGAGFSRGAGVASMQPTL